METVKWGIIGCGDVTEVKSGPAFQKVKHSELIAVMRRDAAKAADYSARHKVPNWYANADLLINDPGVNAIYVATPPSTHGFYAKKAIEAGKPVYIEKPMGLTYAECLEVTELAAKKKVKVFVAYYRRALPGFLKVKELLEENRIGEVRMVNIQLFKHFNEDVNALPWRVDPQIAGGGHFYDLASHQFDFLHFIFGEIDQIHAVVDNQSGKYKAEDILSVSFQFKNGIVGNGIWCFNSSMLNNRDSVEIIGTNGRIEFSTFDFVPVKLINAYGTEEFSYSKPKHVQFNLIEQIVEELRGKGKCISTGISGSETNNTLEKIVDKYYKKDK